MTPNLETSRLLLRPLKLADAEQVQLIFPQWEIVRYLTKQVPWPYPADGAVTYYRDFALPAIERGDEWHWTLRLKSEPERIIGGQQGELLAIREFEPGKYLVVVYRELQEDGFVITAFLTRRAASLNRRKQIWPI